MVFRALIVLFSYGYNIETCKIIEVTFLMLHFCPMRDFSQVTGGAAWPNGKYASALQPDVMYRLILSILQTSGSD